MNVAINKLLTLRESAASSVGMTSSLSRHYLCLATHHPKTLKKNNFIISIFMSNQIMQQEIQTKKSKKKNKN